MNRPYAGPADMPAEIPVFPLPAALLLPRGEMPLNIFEPRYLAMIDAALAGNRLIGMVQPDDDPNEDGGTPSLARIGCAGRITGFQETGDGRVLVTLTGIARFAIVEETTAGTPYRTCRIDTRAFATDFQIPKDDPPVDRPRLLETLDAFLKANDLDADWEDIDKMPSELLVNVLSMMSPYGPREKQALLEARNTQERSEMLIAITERLLLGEADGETLQ